MAASRSNGIIGFKALEAALRQGEGEFRKLAAHSSDGITILEKNGRILEVNEAQCKMFGIPRSEFLKTTPTEMARGEEPNRGAELFKTGTLHYTRKFRRRDGSVFRAEVICKVLPSGKALGIIREITRHKNSDGKSRQSSSGIHPRQPIIRHTAKPIRGPSGKTPSHQSP